MKQRREEVEVEWRECGVCTGSGRCKAPSGLTEQRCAMCAGKGRVLVRAKKRRAK